MINLENKVAIIPGGATLIGKGVLGLPGQHADCPNDFNIRLLAARDQRQYGKDQYRFDKLSRYHVILLNIAYDN